VRVLAGVSTSPSNSSFFLIEGKLVSKGRSERFGQ
jgi:hypothetical protein